MNYTICAALVLCLSLSLSARAEAAPCPGGGLDYQCPAGTTEATIQETLLAASADAVLTFAPGAYTWGAGYFHFYNAKGMTLKCATPNACIVTIVAPGMFCCSEGDFSGNNYNRYRITGFYFQNAPANAILIKLYGDGPTAILWRWRLDHNTFHNFGSGGMLVNYGGIGPGSSVYGVTDHNVISGAVMFPGFHVKGPADPAYLSGPRLGTEQNMFFEDNVFDFDSDPSGGVSCIDGYALGGIVFRHNTVRNCMLASHGALHWGGTANFELYDNTLQVDNEYPNGYRLFHHQGSGQMVAFRNILKHTANPISTSALAVMHYRTAECTFAGGMYDCAVPRCDGLNANLTPVKDGNLLPRTSFYGYPCYHQPGRLYFSNDPTKAVLRPWYFWQNTDNTATGAKVPIGTEDYGTPPPIMSQHHFVAERDFFDAVSKDAQTSKTTPFNGTVGMGFGPLAFRPDTCTHTTAPDGDDGGGVGYWDTDASVLYRCSAPNTWTPYYQPFPYPHYLTEGGGGSPTPPAAPPSVQLVQEAP